MWNPTTLTSCTGGQSQLWGSYTSEIWRQSQMVFQGSSPLDMKVPIQVNFGIVVILKLGSHCPEWTSAGATCKRAAWVSNGASGSMRAFYLYVLYDSGCITDIVTSSYLEFGFGSRTATLVHVHRQLRSVLAISPNISKSKDGGRDLLRITSKLGLSLETGGK